MRSSEVTAIARSRPDFTCGTMLSGGKTAIGMWPATRSMTPGASPLYGTCTSFMPVVLQRYSEVRCAPVAWPGEPKLIDRGFAFASLTSCGSDVAGSEGCTATR